MSHKSKETPLPDACSEKLANDFNYLFNGKISNIHSKFKQDGNFDEYDCFTGYAGTQTKVGVRSK